MNILAIPDLHLPYEHKQAKPFIAWLLRQFKFDQIVLLGDLSDSYFASRFGKSFYAMGGSQELEALKVKIKEWTELIPNAKVAIGNHDRRILSRLDESYLPSVNLHTFLDLPSTWELQDSFIIDNIYFTHGDALPGGRNASSTILNTMHISTVSGHLHSVASIAYRNNGLQTIFSMVAGCLVDIESIAAAYGRTFKDKPLLGAGIILDGVPYWIPLQSFLNTLGSQ